MILGGHTALTHYPNGPSDGYGGRGRGVAFSRRRRIHSSRRPCAQPQLHLPFSAHVDLTYTLPFGVSGSRSRSALRWHDGVGSSAPSPSPRPRPSLERACGLVTCGSLHKYRGQGAHSWAGSMLSPRSVCRTPNSSTSAPRTRLFRKKLRDALIAASISLDRYILADYQPSLAAELEEARADAYLSSYPGDGGKANLEAMITGVPVIVPLDRDGPPLIRFPAAATPLANHRGACGAAGGVGPGARLAGINGYAGISRRPRPRARPVRRLCGGPATAPTSPSDALP